MPRLTLTVLAAAALASCATAPGEARQSGFDKYAGDPRLGEETKKICFASSIDGFSHNERRTVVLHEGRDRFMVEVTGACFDLDSAESIAIDSSTGCLTPGDSIIVARAFGDTTGPNRCMIREIRKWDPKATTAPEGPAEENPA